LNSIAKKVKDAGENPFVFSRLTLEVLKQKYDVATKEIQDKKGALVQERKKQEAHEKLVKEFDDACGKYITSCKDSLTKLSAEVKGTLEEQLSALTKIGGGATSTSANLLGKLLTSANHLEEADIMENSEHTVQELQSFDEGVKTTFSKRTKGIEEAIIASKATNISEEQLNELHQAFKHFDKQNQHKLAKNEFKAACAAVGEDIMDSELDAVFKKYDHDKDGFISFEEYIEFMSSVVKEGSGYEDILASFADLAGGNKIITEQQLRSNIENAEEVEFLLKAMPKVDGGYDYVAYTQKTFGKK